MTTPTMDPMVLFGGGGGSSVGSASEKDGDICETPPRGQSEARSSRLLGDSQQPISSELSVQSMLWSHFLCFPMHWPLVQVNWSGGQRTWTEKAHVHSLCERRSREDVGGARRRHLSPSHLFSSERS